MLLRSITTFAAVAVACVVCLRSDADARGGGGFHGGAVGARFHMGVGHFAFQHGRPFIRGDMHRHLHGSRMRHAELTSGAVAAETGIAPAQTSVTGTGHPVSAMAFAMHPLRTGNGTPAGSSADPPAFTRRAPG